MDIRRWDVTEILTTPEHIADYLEAAMEENDPAYFRKAVGNAMRAMGATRVARETGIARESLYKAFGDNGNPTLETLSKVLAAMGVRLSVARVA